MGKGLSNRNKNVIENSEGKTSLAQVYLEQAEEYRISNKHREAVDRYLHSILINKENPTPYIGLALSYKSLKNYTKAVIALEKAEKISPYDVVVQKELALCNIINGNFEKGIKYLISSIKLEPDNVEIQMQLALVHEMIDEEDMALMIYQKIIETNPGYLRAYIQKATLYMHLDDYLESAKLFRTILKLSPDYFRAYLALGICYEKLGNIPSAKRFYNKYLKFPNAETNRKEVLKRLAELKQNNKKSNNLKLILN